MKNFRYRVVIVLLTLFGTQWATAATSAADAAAADAAAADAAAADAAARATSVYRPSALEKAYNINVRDISSTARYADHILVMDELPFTPFNVLDAIQGRVPGVRVYNQGWNSFAVIRGWQRPLYVIDGMPVDARAANMMNPNDVATVEVHKGFGASMFGMRGSGGAIVINTRRG